MRYRDDLHGIRQDAKDDGVRKSREHLSAVGSPIAPERVRGRRIADLVERCINHRDQLDAKPAALGLLPLCRVCQLLFGFGQNP
jgi:hypothetical protein